MKLFRYLTFAYIFHVSRLCQNLPFLPFKFWVYFMQNKLYAANKMSKLKHEDWDKVKV